MNLFETNPLEKILPKTQKNVLWALALITMVLFVVLGILDQPLKTNEAPNGIVSFELAGSFNQSQKILSSWNHQAKLYAALSIGVDYLFLVAYSLFFAFLIFKLSKLFVEHIKWLVQAGIIIGWLQFLAAIFDSVENYFLIRLLFSSQNELFSHLAFYFASAKFLLILLGIIYILLGLGLHFIFKTKHL